MFIFLLNHPYHMDIMNISEYKTADIDDLSIKATRVTERSAITEQQFVLIKM